MTIQKAGPLRDEGVLIIGSGNLVHNLSAYAWGRQKVKPLDWAVRFETKARELIVEGQNNPLIHYENLGQDAILAAPTGIFPGNLDVLDMQFDIIYVDNQKLKIYF